MSHILFTGTSIHISCAPVFIHWNLYSYLMCTWFHSLKNLFISHVHLFSFTGNFSYHMCTCFHSLKNLFISHMHLSLFIENSIHISYAPLFFTGTSIHNSCAPVFIIWKLFLSHVHLFSLTGNYSYLMCSCFHSQEPLFITHVTYFIH